MFSWCPIPPSASSACTEDHYKHSTAHPNLSARMYCSYIGTDFWSVIVDELNIKVYSCVISRQMGPVKGKSAFEHEQNGQTEIILRMRKVSSGHVLHLIHFIVFKDSVSGQRRSWSDCADAQADLGLRCPHMPEDTFSHGPARIMTKHLIKCGLHKINDVTRIIEVKTNCYIGSGTLIKYISFHVFISK